MAENRRKSENIRRANRVIQTRTFVLMLVLGVAVFLVLALKLYQLQIKQHDYYQSKALDQQTRSTVVTASRGTIYDRNGNELAVSATSLPRNWRRSWKSRRPSGPRRVSPPA